jgi:hypothetical protein
MYLSKFRSFSSLSRYCSITYKRYQPQFTKETAHGIPTYLSFNQAFNLCLDRLYLWLEHVLHGIYYRVDKVRKLEHLFPFHDSHNLGIQRQVSVLEYFLVRLSAFLGLKRGCTEYSEASKAELGLSYRHILLKLVNLESNPVLSCETSIPDELVARIDLFPRWTFYQHAGSLEGV